MTSNDVLIRVEHLVKAYNDGAIKALDGVSTDIKRGDVTVVIGPSGSGKSTFLRSLNLLEQPTSICTGRKWAWCSSISICSPTRRSCRI